MIGGEYGVHLLYYLVEKMYKEFYVVKFYFLLTLLRCFSTVF